MGCAGMSWRRFMSVWTLAALGGGGRVLLAVVVGGAAVAVVAVADDGGCCWVFWAESPGVGAGSCGWESTAGAAAADIVVGVVVVVGSGSGCWLLRETRQRWKDDEDDVAAKYPF